MGCYSYFSFTSLQLGFYSQSSVVSNLKGSFTLKMFCFRLSFLSHFPIILLLYLFYIELMPIIYIFLISIAFLSCIILYSLRTTIKNLNLNLNLSMIQKKK